MRLLHDLHTVRQEPAQAVQGCCLSVPAQEPEGRLGREGGEQVKIDAPIKATVHQTEKCGCKPGESCYQEGGDFWLSPDKSASSSIVYLSGPMTGKPEWNYPEFNQIEGALRTRGYGVLNPARHFDGDTTRPRVAYMKASLRDVEACDAVAVLDGWRDSEGARLEVDYARQLGKPVYHWQALYAADLSYGLDMSGAEQIELVGPETQAEVPPRADVLQEAARLITGDRNNSYGPPTQDFARTAGALSALGYRGPDGRALLAHDVAILVGMVKMSRLMWSPEKRDNWTDLAGYAGCGYECAISE